MHDAQFDLPFFTDVHRDLARGLASGRFVAIDLRIAATPRCRCAGPSK